MSDSDSIPSHSLDRGSTWRGFNFAVGTLFVLLLVGVVRLCVSSRPESEEFASSMQTFLSGASHCVTELRTPAQSYPDVQYEFWREETARIIRQHPNDAELIAASALMLHRPCLWYGGDVLREVAQTHDASFLFQSRVSERIAELRMKYDVQGTTAATELMKRATEISPEDTRWWRMRAILLWPHGISEMPPGPVHASWESVLEMAQRNDPGNALYQVLHATELSQRALRLDSDGFVQIADADAWSKVVSMAKEASSSPKLELGEPCMAGLVRLHALSNHPVATRTESIRARFVATLTADKVAILARNLLRMSEAKHLESDFDQQAELSRLSISITDLAFERSDGAVRHSMALAYMRRACREELLRLERQRGGACEQLAADLQEVSEWEQALRRATSKFNQNSSSAGVSLWRVLSPISLQLFTWTLIPAILLAVVWLLYGRPSPRLAIPAWPFVGLSIGGVSSVLLKGGGPAGLISDASQHWVVTGMLFAFLCSLLGGVAMRFQFRFSIRQLLITCAVVALLQCAIQNQINWRVLVTPGNLHTSPNALVQIFIDQQPDSLVKWGPGPVWINHALFEWLVQDGPAHLVAIFLGCAGVRVLWSKRGAQIITETLAATSLLSLACIAVWVWSEPVNYAIVRPKQMQIESYIRSIDQYYKPIEELVEHELSISGAE